MIDVLIVQYCHYYFYSIVLYMSLYAILCNRQELLIFLWRTMLWFYDTDGYVFSY